MSIPSHPAFSSSKAETTSRFNFDAQTLEEAKNYMYCRGRQLLKHGYRLTVLEEFDWGISAYFEKNNKVYQSIYLLEGYRAQGIFQQHITHTIITSHECGIEHFLIRKKIDYAIERLTPFQEYQLISDYYGDQKASRSGVYLMNHIDEGLFILNKIGASEIAQKAYCLHPIIQSDEALVANYTMLSGVDVQTVIAVTEYRSVANEYLSHRTVDSLEEIRLSPLTDVNHMLMADKIQNKKDFELYHQDTHPRSKELTVYFNNWLSRLGISPEFYEECKEFCL